MLRFRIFLLSGLILGLLSACSGFKALDSRGCPAPVRVTDASSYTVFKKGTGRDIIDVAFRGQIDKAVISCVYRNDLMRSTIRFEIIATKGPAANGDEVSLPFFVAIVDNRNNIIAKQIFDTTITFDKGRRRAGVFEEIEQNIQLKPRERADIFRILFGFQLSREQVERRQKRSR